MKKKKEKKTTIIIKKKKKEKQHEDEFCQLGLTLVWWRLPITLIFCISSSYESDDAVNGLKFTGIDTGWHCDGSFTVEAIHGAVAVGFLNAWDTRDESIHIGI